MKSRNGIATIALWTLLLAPLLCGMGVLVHGCVGDMVEYCHHELQCAADPCQILAVGMRDKDSQWDDLSAHSLRFFVWATLPDTAPDVSATDGIPVAELIVDAPHDVAFGRTLPLIC